MEEIVNKIIDIEWKMFDLVHNAGGRASCQDDHVTFVIMRSSQLAAWNDATRESWLADLEAAKAAGRNLIEEKYARMMKHTFPDEYAALEQYLPVLTDEVKEIVAEIVPIQLHGMQEIQKKYPNLSMMQRPATEDHDETFGTSFATYLEGELLTYSEKTLKLYLENLKSCGGYDYGMKILQSTASQYGYPDVDTLETVLAKR